MEYNLDEIAATLARTPIGEMHSLMWQHGTSSVVYRHWPIVMSFPSSIDLLKANGWTLDEFADAESKQPADNSLTAYFILHCHVKSRFNSENVKADSD